MPSRASNLPAVPAVPSARDLPAARLPPSAAYAGVPRHPDLTLDVVALAVDGDLDPVGAERLQALLDDAVAPGRRLVLDLAGVGHLSSAALTVLVAVHCRLRASGGALVVHRPSAAIVRVLRISGLHGVVLVEPAF